MILWLDDPDGVSSRDRKPAQAGTTRARGAADRELRPAHQVLPESGRRHRRRAAARHRRRRHPLPQALAGPAPGGGLGVPRGGELLSGERRGDHRRQDGARTPRGRAARAPTASLAHFATGVSGVFYPMAMLRALAARGTEFMSRCPRADDIWLHWVAATRRRPDPADRAEGRGTSRIFPGPRSRRWSRRTSTQGANDLRIAELYTEADVTSLSASVARLRGSSEAG